MKLKHFKEMFSKNRKLVKLLKIGMAFYLVTFLFSYLTSDTSAYFTSSTQTSGTIQVGTWEIESESESDETSIVFDDTKEQTVTSCPATIETVVTNKGENNMMEPKKYVVYFSENNVSEEQMTEIPLSKGEGSFDPLDSGETKALTFTANEPGFYKIAVLSESNQKMAVSESIKVSCNDEEDESEEKLDEQSEEQTEEVEEQSEEQTEEVEEQSEEQTEEVEEETEEEMDKDKVEEKNEDQSEVTDEEGD